MDGDSIPYEFLTGRAKLDSPEPIRSDPRTMTSYRAELHGIYKLLCALRKGGYSTARIELWCDSESAIDLLNDPTDLTPEALTKAEGDLLTALTRTLRSFPNITLKHVRGHQLRNTSYQNLPFEAQLNEDCDVAAKGAMRTNIPTTSRPEPIGGHERNCTSTTSWSLPTTKAPSHAPRTPLAFASE